MDFELQLIHRDQINVVYILKLVAKLKTGSPATRKNQKRNCRLADRWTAIEKFINENLPHITDAFEAYKYEQKQQALKQLSEEEKLSPDKLEEVIGNYIFTERKPLPDHIVNMLEVKPKILERKSVVQRIR